jgi:hypothetical protein
MQHRSVIRSVALLAVAFSSVACGSDPTGSGGRGDVTFTTWGEDYIEEEIPAGEDGGFVDGWSLVYSKFLVVIRNIQVADASGAVAASSQGSVLFDHTGAGVKPVVRFDGLEARHWDRVSYEIGPADADTTKHDSASDADLESMVNGGHSLRLVADVSKGAETMHIDWSFDLATGYVNCQSEQDGKEELGVVVTNNGSADVQLTIHGDHPFYDRLQASPAGIETYLRFDAMEAADKNPRTGDSNGVVTLSELDAVDFDPLVYDLSGFPDVSSMGDFVRSLVRTVGHYRGEGECEIEYLD